MGTDADGSPGAGVTALPEPATETGAAGADGAGAASPSDSVITGSDAGGTDDDGVGTGLTGTLDDP